MATYKVRLRQTKEAAENTFSFHFDKPHGFQFQAGQFIRLTLIDPVEKDEKGDRRNFTIASSPFEEELMIATRLRDSAFKHNLKAMPAGSEVTMAGPFGNLTLTGVSGPAVFLTGGIGITPFRSIALQAAHDRLPNHLYLFYANRRPEDAAFLNELHQTEKVNPNFTFVPTMTQMEKSRQSWTGATGYINRALLQKFVKDITVPAYYIAGPPAMVSAMKQMLNEIGISEQQIKSEDFPGY